jgi:hypothetical protein
MLQRALASAIAKSTYDHARHEFCIGWRSVRDLTHSQQIHIPPNDDEKKQFYYQSAMVRESKEGGKREREDLRIPLIIPF